jgi:hypothetical protein
MLIVGMCFQHNDTGKAIIDYIAVVVRVGWC